MRRRWLNQVNLKGKKTLLAACGCCDIINRKEKELKKQHQKEMREPYEKKTL